MPSHTARACAAQKLPRQVGAVDLETLVGAPVALGQAEVVEHRADVEQLGVGLDPAVAALQGREEEHPAGMVEQQRGAVFADQLGGLAGQLGVRDVDPGDRLGHVLRLSRRASPYMHVPSSHWANLAGCASSLTLSVRGWHHGQRPSWFGATPVLKYRLAVMGRASVYAEKLLASMVAASGNPAGSVSRGE
jgi:hypothetical protein